MKSTALLALLSLALVSCGSRTGLHEPLDASVATDAATCPATSPVCVAPNADPCGAPGVVPAVCDEALTWRCPPGSRPYERAADPTPVCRPLFLAGGELRSLGGSLVRIPTSDRCLWIAEDVTLTSGAQLRNVGFLVDPAAPFGTCPRDPVFAEGTPRSVVTIEGGDPSLVVQITGGYRLNGETRVTYRMFRADGGTHFGLTHLGSGLARWDATTRQIVVPSPSVLRFPIGLDLGDASLAIGDRAYVWGCPPPIESLTERCVVARLDPADRMELFAGNDRWMTSDRRSDGATVFDAGPWVSSVVPVGNTSRLAHVFAVGFGSDLRVHSAAAPEGPWSAGAPIARCDLPTDDPDAFCAGPVVHLELADPTRPGELPVTYGVGTTAPGGGGARPESYWPRLQWVRVP